MAGKRKPKLCSAQLWNGRTCRNPAGKNGRCWRHGRLAKIGLWAAGYAGMKALDALADPMVQHVVKHFTGTAKPLVISKRRSPGVKLQARPGSRLQARRRQSAKKR
jgi:hypothetical protein